MVQAGRWLGLVLVVAGALAPSTPTLAGSSSHGEGTRVEKTEAGKPARVRVHAIAAERLGIKTTAVRDEDKVGKSGTRQRMIPYSAVLYDLDGKTWAYTNPETLVFVRQRIEVTAIRGDVAMLSDGPPAGTQVVSVGAAELLGIELGVGK
jgi:membrane protein implicated in regulation of membrane protease activity